jgi:PAP2 superfamily
VALLGGAAILVAVIRGRPRLALAAAAVVGGANVATQLLKKALPRPDLLGGDALGLGNTLPSGHATVAMSIALAAVLVVPRRARGAVAAAGALYAAVVGVATLTAGWHRPSDAAAAFAVVVAVAATAAAWPRPRTTSNRAERERSRSPVSAPLLVSVGIGLCGLSFAALVAVVAARRLGRLDAVDLGSAYIAAAIAIAGSALLLTGLLLVALRSPYELSR